MRYLKSLGSWMGRFRLIDYIGIVDTVITRVPDSSKCRILFRGFRSLKSWI
jgi:hypothetical protein